MCSTEEVRWQGQDISTVDEAALPGLESMGGLVRSVTTPEFAGMTFHEVVAKSALNHVPSGSAMPFSWTVNPYRGCSHACTYCLDPETLVMTAEGRHKRLGDVRVGEDLMGTRVDGAYRRYVPTTVRAVWPTRKAAYRITIADGTEIIASGDHRFLTERGWKHVTGTTSGAGRRPHLTTGNRLQGFGMGAPRAQSAFVADPDFERGYLSGMIRGDGLIFHIASVAARKPDMSGVSYQATKAGVAALAYATMEEERANGIRVTALLPGLTDTPLVLQRPTPTDPAMLAKALKPEDIAETCLFLLRLPARAHVAELVLVPSR